MLEPTISIKKICEKILSYYKNNMELRDNLSESDSGYLQCLTDISLGKYNSK